MRSIRFWSVLWVALFARLAGADEPRAEVTVVRGPRPVFHQEIDITLDPDRCQWRRGECWLRLPDNVYEFRFVDGTNVFRVHGASVDLMREIEEGGKDYLVVYTGGSVVAGTDAEMRALIARGMRAYGKKLKLVGLFFQQ